MLKFLAQNGLFSLNSRSWIPKRKQKSLVTLACGCFDIKHSFLEITQDNFFFLFKTTTKEIVAIFKYLDFFFPDDTETFCSLPGRAHFENNFYLCPAHVFDITIWSRLQNNIHTCHQCIMKICTRLFSTRYRSWYTNISHRRLSSHPFCLIHI